MRRSPTSMPVPARAVVAIARLLFTTSLLLASPALAKTYLVLPDSSGDVPDIWTAIHVAQPGDTVLLGDGVFTGWGNRNLDFQGKPITVCSRSRNPQTCIIDCGALGGQAGLVQRGFLFSSGEDSLSVLRGVTVRAGCAFGN